MFLVTHRTTLVATQTVDTRRDLRLHFAPRGAVAQLGERLNGIQEVESSILFGSTIFPPYFPVTYGLRLPLGGPSALP